MINVRIRSIAYGLDTSCFDHDLIKVAFKQLNK